MAIEDGQYILDVASQIASLGLGFNSGAMFGAAQFLESWTGRTDTPIFATVRSAFEQLLQRQLGWSHLNMSVCNSGAEAIESALGDCFEKRSNREARKLIAFEHSFHGRMMVALASTWNPAKREPFAWPGYETAFAHYPEMDSDNVNQPPAPDNWHLAWSRATRSDFELCLNTWKSKFAADQLLMAEIASLVSIKKHLESGLYFAILIEPMQCEGGDRYSSARFHNGLINLARAFAVPLVYDEIQTGFGLGGDFFWHKKFGLVDYRDQPTRPDYVVTAKKAQVGAVLSQHPIEFPEQCNATSIFRGYINASMIDQFQSEIKDIEKWNREHVTAIIDRYSPRIGRPRASGLCFAFDFENESDLKRFVGHRFEHGLLYYPAGKRAVRFRFNLSFRKPSVEQAWDQIDAALAATFDQAGTPASVSLRLTNPASYYDFHEQFIANKLDLIRNSEYPVDFRLEEFIKESLDGAGIDASQLDVTRLDANNYQRFRNAIWELQTSVYEPLRQTAIEKFDQLIQADNNLAFVVTERKKIIGMAYAAPSSNFPAERGLRSDAYYEDPTVVYMLDLTVVPAYRGTLGRILKQAICLLAQQQGITAIQGRNRDRLARGMWAINLSLGSFSTRILHDDYLDDEPFRDCIMYRCPMKWQSAPIHLSSAVTSPLDDSEIDSDFVQAHLPSLVNKITLSNFVTRSYLKLLADVFSMLPVSLQHGYSASGLSECVDKIAKSIWLRRKPRTRLLTLNGNFFGGGSFLSRSLSGIGEPYFHVTKIDFSADDDRFITDLESHLRSGEMLAVFIEPLGLRSGKKIPIRLLVEIRKLCSKHDTPLVFNDSGGAAYRYSDDSFLPSHLPNITPDAGMLWLGGQMAICYLSDEYFVDTPLTLISTWDGDAFSLAQFHRAMQNIERDVSAYLNTKQEYHKCLVQLLSDNQISDDSIDRGVGTFAGPIQCDMAPMFDRASDGSFLSLPSYGQMRKFVQYINNETLE